MFMSSKILKLKSLQCTQIPSPESSELHTRLRINDHNDVDTLYAKVGLNNTLTINREYKVMYVIKIDLWVGELLITHRLPFNIKPDAIVPLEEIEKRLSKGAPIKRPIWEQPIIGASGSASRDTPGIPIRQPLYMYEGHLPRYNPTKKARQPYGQPLSELEVYPYPYPSWKLPLPRIPRMQYFTGFRPIDFIGELNIYANIVAPDINFEFEAEGYTFILRYSLENLPPIDCDNLKDPEVKALLENFRNSTAPSKWPEIDKDQLVEDMKDRICDPIKVNQKGSDLCGSASIVYELVKRDPKNYIRICRNLYETGSFKSNNENYKASRNLRNSEIYEDLATADWMLMATLTEEANIFLNNMDADSGPLAMMATPRAIRKWLKDILLFSKVKQKIAVFNEYEVLEEAKRACNNGGVAIILVNLKLFDDVRLPDRRLVPNHYVSYDCCLRKTRHRRYFKCYTWGRIEPLNVAKRRFRKCIFRVITGEN